MITVVRILLGVEFSLRGLQRMARLQRKRICLEDLSLASYWRILRRRKWYAISFLTVVVTLVTVASFNMTPKYEATRRISIRPEDLLAEFKDVAPTTTNNWDYEMNLDTQAQILQSDSLAFQTIKALQLDKNVHFLQGTMQKGASQRELLSLFRSGLKVSIVAHSNVIQIQYSSTDPRLSTDIVNTLVNKYIEHNFQMRYYSMQQASKWLSKQLMDLRPKVDAPYLEHPRPPRHWRYWRLQPPQNPPTVLETIAQ